MKQETVEDFLARGGQVSRVPEGAAQAKEDATAYKKATGRHLWMKKHLIPRRTIVEWLGQPYVYMHSMKGGYAAIRHLHTGEVRNGVNLAWPCQHGEAPILGHLLEEVET